MLDFLMNIAIFGALTWYFDHVDESNRGIKFEKLFFLNRKYWGIKDNNKEDSVSKTTEVEFGAPESAKKQSIEKLLLNSDDGKI